METLLVVLACVTVSSCSIVTELYVRSFGYSLVSSFVQPNARSAIECSRCCENTTGCKAFTFSQTDSTCTLAASFSSTNASNTGVYIRISELPVTVHISINVPFFPFNKRVFVCKIK